MSNKPIDMNPNTISSSSWNIFFYFWLIIIHPNSFMCIELLTILWFKAPLDLITTSEYSFLIISKVSLLNEDLSPKGIAKNHD